MAMTQTTNIVSTAACAQNGVQVGKSRSGHSRRSFRHQRRMSWQPYTGPRDGSGWISDRPGEVRYQKDKPKTDQNDKLKTDNSRADSVFAFRSKSSTRLTEDDMMFGGWTLTIGIYDLDRAQSIVASITHKPRLTTEHGGKGGKNQYQKTRRENHRTNFEGCVSRNNARLQTTIKTEPTGIIGNCHSSVAIDIKPQNGKTDVMWRELT